MKYTDTHEWLELEPDLIAVVGITQFAAKELGDIVYIELPAKDKIVTAGQEIAVLESTKAAADVYSPVSGTVITVNELLNNTPELINQSPQKNGWICKIRLSKPEELDQLMDEKAYQDMVSGS